MSASADVPDFDTETTTTQLTRTTIRLDFSYLSSAAGILKCLEIVWNLLGYICIMSTIFRHHSRGSYFSTVAVIALCFTSTLLVLYLFNVPNKLYIIPWLMIEFLFCAIWAILYFVAACLVADWGWYLEAFAAAAFFGFCASVCYALDAVLKFKEVKSGRKPTNPTTVSV